MRNVLTILALILTYIDIGVDPGRFTEWVEHVKTALPDIIDLCTKERPDDRHRYLTIIYKGGLEVPSWVASDGTLRLLNKSPQ